MRTSKSKTTVGATVTLVALGASLLAPAAANAAEISIADPALQACVNAALNQDATEPITDTQAATLTALTCNSAGILRIEGIEALTNVTLLELGSNQIEDFTPLSSMTQLTELSLGRTGIVDLSPLSTLTQLTTLYVGFNGLADVAPLADLTTLTFLELTGNSIVDVAPLASLVNLTSLSLSANRIKDVSPLSALAERLALDPDGNLDAYLQNVSMPATTVGEVQESPAIGFLGSTDRVDVVNSDPAVSIASIAAGGLSWTFSAPGTSKFDWEQILPGPGSVEFGGYFAQTATVALVATTLNDDVASATTNTTITIDVLANDGAAAQPALDASTLTLLDSAGNPTTTVAVSGGTFTVNAGRIQFVPDSTFVGSVPAVQYQVGNVASFVSVATLTVTVNAAVVPPTTTTPDGAAAGTTGSVAASTTGNANTNTPRLAATGGDDMTSWGVLALALLTAGAGLLLFRARRAS